MEANSNHCGFLSWCHFYLLRLVSIASPWYIFQSQIGCSCRKWVWKNARWNRSRFNSWRMPWWMSKLSIHRLDFAGFCWEDWSPTGVMNLSVFLGRQKSNNATVWWFERFKESKGPTPQCHVYPRKVYKAFFLRDFWPPLLNRLEFAGFCRVDWGPTGVMKSPILRGGDQAWNFPTVWWVNELTIHYFHDCVRDHHTDHFEGVKC